MCIRDSSASVSNAQLTRDQLLESCIQLIDEKIKSREDQDCLLYTSDAADERSSVDLGGRRIIKKKKNRSKETYKRRRDVTHKIREQ
mgnify:CR=1 FL=1